MVKAKNVELKLALGARKGQYPGFKSVNIAKPCDIQHDLNKFPYPFEDISVDELIMNHTLEHLDKPVEVMKEIWRICKNGAKIQIGVPRWDKDIGANYLHKHVFQPSWFRQICATESVLNKEQEKFWKPFNFRMIKMFWIRGKFKFWKRYRLHVVIEVVKRRGPVSSTAGKDIVIMTRPVRE